MVIKNDKYIPIAPTLSELGETKTYEMEVTSSDTCMRVALAYANRIKYAEGEEHDPDATPMEEMLMADLTLTVYAPDGEYVTSAMAFGKNLLVVEFNPRLHYGPGTYIKEVEVQEEGDDARPVNFGVAWR